MDLMSKYQGVIKGVFANENSGSNEDSYVERLLDRISNGKLAEDRRTAMVELQSVVAESRAAQLAFGAMGFPVLLGVLKEERDDVEMVRGSLETFVGALTPIGHGKGPNEVEPALMNSDLLSREVDSISLLLSLLSEEDFYVRYYTLQLLTALLTNSPNRLQEAILTIPRGITRLMDMLMDREVIRNEALLLLTYLTREAEEIQKIVVFEGAFEKIFSIIKEEGGSEGGVVVQDSIELLNNLLRNNSSNQVLLRETIGFEPLVSILKLRGSSYKFTQQKTVNLLSVLETINLLIKGGSECVTNKTILVQRKLLDHLLMMGVESQWAPVAVRCGALHCIGELVNGHSQNRDVLASKLLGEDPQIELALNSLLRIILRTSSVQEFISADYVFKTFCEKNPIGQTMLASTLIPQPHLMTHAPLEEDVNMSFGSMLLHGLTMSESNGDLETCCRAASVLSHIMKDNTQCKERVLKIEIESPTPSLENSEPLMHRMVKYLALASSSTKGKEVKSLEVTYIQPIILKLLIIWLSNCPNAVKIFLNSRPHLTYLLELVNNSSTTVCVRGLSAILLGECVIFNQNNALSIADAITQKIGVTLYFLKLEELQKSFLFKPNLDKKSLSRSASASTVEIEDDENEKNEDHPILGFVFDSEFVSFVKELEGYIREKILDVYSNVNSQVAVLPSELEQKKDENESDHDYIKRLKLFIEKQCVEIQELLSRNAAFAEELVKTGGDGSGKVKTGGTGGDGLEKVQIEKLKGEVLEASKKLETVNNEKMRIEADLKSLSDAYNSLEQANFQLEKEVKSLKDGGATPPGYGGATPDNIDIEKIKEEAREEAQKESEVELSDLLVCLGQEQTKVERLMSKLIELGVDADELLDGIGDENALPEDDDDDDNEEED